jgi:nucleotide-binding universal stress UspA family protein
MHRAGVAVGGTVTSLFTHILVPVDFSKASQKAMHYGVVLALKCQAKLTAAHIVPSSPALIYPFPIETYEFEKKAVAEARRTLPEEIPAAYRERLNTQVVVKVGDVRDELLGIIRNEKVDLVIMGTHGRRNLGRFILGSTTESMLRQVPVPVLTVSESGAAQQADSPFDVPFRRILYATDLAEATAAGVHYCVQLARVFGAHLTLLNVMDLHDAVALDSEADIHARLMGRLHKEVGKEHCDDLNIATEVVKGVAHKEIPRYAEDNTADLIVINLQSKGLLDRALLGSTAERVIRSSRIPVLSIPGTTAKERA